MPFHTPSDLEKIKIYNQVNIPTPITPVPKSIHKLSSAYIKYKIVHIMGIMEENREIK
jgi:hypothetical protein